ncbi:MAG: hypothetical protein AB7V43_05120 [Acidimicrobiia bacterium]
MHPIERMRYVARSSGADHATVARETAAALSGLAFDHAGVVTSCRRVVERHPTSGPVWWLASSVLVSDEPVEAAWTAAELLSRDRTPTELSHALPDDSSVVILGWPELIGAALPRRGDVRIRVVDVFDEARGLVHALRRADTSADLVPSHGLGAAVVASDLVLLEASAVGPDHALVVAGSRAAAAVARHSGIPVWLVAGVGRVLPAPTWKALESRLDLTMFHESDELLPLDLVDRVAGPDGLADPSTMARSATCPVAPELFRLSS